MALRLSLDNRYNRRETGVKGVPHVREKREDKGEDGGEDGGVCQGKNRLEYEVMRGILSFLMTYTELH